MKVFFLTHHSFPHLGGVEKHIYEVSKYLQAEGNKVKVISRNDIKYPEFKFIGLVYIWFWLFKERKLIKEADIVHIHDVFIWYLPFRFLYSKKPVFTTFHGWEGVWPIPLKNIFLKRLSAWLSWKKITVGKYICKYYGIKSDLNIYGGTNKIGHIEGLRKIKNSYVYVGRLDKDTGVLSFLKTLEDKKNAKVDFVGDGPLRFECSGFGVVHGFSDPAPFLRKAEYAVPGGYLSYIEAKGFRCKIKVFPDNILKKDYWDEILKVKKFPTWEKIANEYLNLYNSFK